LCLLEILEIGSGINRKLFHKNLRMSVLDSFSNPLAFSPMASKISRRPSTCPFVCLAAASGKTKMQDEEDEAVPHPRGKSRSAKA
jgi:hypothetical protein